VLDPERPIREEKRTNCCSAAIVRFVPIATDAPQHDRRKKKDRLAAVSPKSDQVF
jgi:hypothetical protein